MLLQSHVAEFHNIASKLIYYWHLYQDIVPVGSPRVDNLTTASMTFAQLLIGVMLTSLPHYEVDVSHLRKLKSKAIKDISKKIYGIDMVQDKIELHRLLNNASNVNEYAFMFIPVRTFEN